MGREWAELLVRVVSVYSGLGIVFGVFFAIRGVRRIDPAAQNAPWSFRILILAGAAALWPLLAWRWHNAGDGPPTESNAHREARR